MIMEPVRGVYYILATPFTEDGQLDEDSLRTLTDGVIRAGVDGITALGVAGEAHKLTDEERRRVLGIVMEVNAGRVPIIVGTSRDGTLPTIQASLEAKEAGAAGIMVAPPTFLPPGPALTKHYQAIGEAVGLSIVLQDFPIVNGVTMSPKAMAEIVKAVPQITTIKLEDTPTPQRIAQTLALLEGHNVSIVGGLGGMYLLDELRRGGAGNMSGFAYPEVLVEIVRAWEAGDRQRATETYYRYLPILVFEGQPKLGHAIRKEILRRRGLIAVAALRQPGPVLDEGTAADLTETLDYLKLEETFTALA